MKITVDMVMACRPCSEYTREIVEELADGRESISAMDVVSLPIPLFDRAWLFSHLLATRDLTRAVIRGIVQEALVGHEIPAAYLAWLESGDEDLRNDAFDVAWNAEQSLSCAAWSAARLAANYANYGNRVCEVAVYASKRHLTDPVHPPTMEKYITWMAEWLDSHEEEYDDEDNG